MKGLAVIADWRQELSQKRSATPHPTRYAGHLLPQGEKDALSA